jgi:Spy/CpxP family protein refolding chaperone
MIRFVTVSTRALLLGAALLTAGTAVAAPAFAQTPQPPQATPQPGAAQGIRPGARDPLADAFFSPELVMRYQQEIGLTAAQRTAIVNAISAAQPRFVEAQWELEPANTALAELLRGERVNEQAVLTQIDRVLDIERQIKHLQVELMVRIKNQLTAEQQTQLARRGGTSLRGYIRSPGMGSMLNQGLKTRPNLSLGNGVLGIPNDFDFDFDHDFDMSLADWDMDFDWSGLYADWASLYHLDSDFHLDMPDLHLDIPEIRIPPMHLGTPHGM